MDLEVDSFVEELEKIAANALRRHLKLLEFSPDPQSRWFHYVTPGGRPAATIKARSVPGSPLQVQTSQVDPQFKGMGLGRKLYGDVLAEHGDLVSDSQVSEQAANVYRRLGAQQNPNARDVMARVSSTLSDNPKQVPHLESPGEPVFSVKTPHRRVPKNLVRLEGEVHPREAFSKVANGDMLEYFQKHPKKLKEKLERDRRKEKTAQIYPYQQKTQWTCSAACLKAVLAHYGLRVPELLAIQAVGTIPNKGAEVTQIAEGARKFGFEAFDYDFDSLDQAKLLTDSDIPIICDIQSFNHPGKGHYVVLVDINARDVQLMDPNTPGNWRVISRAEMEARWWDREMAPPHPMRVKWGVVILPPEGA